MPELAVETFVADFEAGLWQGLRGAFDEPTIKGCAFHFGQALWRKAMELGLKVLTISNYIIIGLYCTFLVLF